MALDGALPDRHRSPSSRLTVSIQLLKLNNSSESNITLTSDRLLTAQRFTGPLIVVHYTSSRLQYVVSKVMIQE